MQQLLLFSMATCLGKNCSSSVYRSVCLENCCQFMYILICLLVFFFFFWGGGGAGIWDLTVLVLDQRILQDKTGSKLGTIYAV